MNQKTYTRPGNQNNWEIGYIAEEFEALGLKQLIFYDEDGSPRSICYRKIVLYIIEVIKELDQEVNNLKKNHDLRNDTICSGSILSIGIFVRYI